MKLHKMAPVIPMLLTLLYALFITQISGHAITPAPSLPSQLAERVNLQPHNGTKLAGGGMFANQPSLHTNCDGVGILTCPTGTCYTGLDGYIGCCSVSSCAPRTTCIEYNPNSKADCDMNTGGCVVCSSAAPKCVLLTNDYYDQYAMYCSTTGLTVTTSYANLITTGSTASGAPSTTTVSSNTSSASSSFSSSITSSPASKTSDPSSSTSSLASTSVRIFDGDSGAGTYLSPGAIAGIVIGSIAAIGLFGLIYWIMIAIADRMGRHINEITGPSTSNRPAGAARLGIQEAEGSTPASAPQPSQSTAIELESLPLSRNPRSEPPPDVPSATDRSSYPGQPRYAPAPANQAVEQPTTSVKSPAISSLAGSTPRSAGFPASLAEAGEPERRLSRSLSTMSGRGGGPTYHSAEHALAGGRLFDDVSDEGGERS
ncbi:hypothetical protein NA57DRAFT_51235 [Rhizodiscina lignyota]|uniref:Uncharacterized protein n=1 Tax=Rhizodiscina lignyota TaxID=1504668 RepID=A0A9P4IS72_9PEZI|nr:hypothetical protein NA57DRAFT_51235 [Rhizodiscina lignyota]